MVERMEFSCEMSCKGDGEQVPFTLKKAERGQSGSARWTCSDLAFKAPYRWPLNFMSLTLTSFQPKPSPIWLISTCAWTNWYTLLNLRSLFLQSRMYIFLLFISWHCIHLEVTSSKRLFCFWSTECHIKRTQHFHMKLLASLSNVLKKSWPWC